MAQATRSEQNQGVALLQERMMASYIISTTMVRIILLETVQY